MAADRRAHRLLRRIEGSVWDALGSSDPVLLAYSGGLGSTLTAAVARKRCDLLCVVAGVRGAPDLEATRLASAYLDYRIEVLPLSRTACLRLARRVAETYPRLAAAEVADLVPIEAVRESHPDGAILVGFGGVGSPVGPKGYLGARDLRCPLLEASSRRNPVDRRPLADVADVLGLPKDFTRVRRRSPGAGSGVDGTLRAIAASRKLGFRRLVRPHDFH